jgi:hypothetical protein
MNKLRLLISHTIPLLFILGSCGQPERNILGESFAKEQLASALADTLKREILTDTIISDRQSAINISEAILFKVYGKDNIIKQKPYETFFIDGYWVISGTLPNGYDGGTFLIILNSKYGQVIRLTHGE